MEGLNSLLIIASAFSVFGQYIDNNHRSDIQSIESKLREMDLSALHLKNVKGKWDDLMSKTYLRAKPFVLALFVYLVVVVLAVIVSELHGIGVIDSLGVIDFINKWSVTSLGVVLLFISSWMIFRLVRMGAERDERKMRAQEIELLREAVEKGVQDYKNSNGEDS